MRIFTELACFGMIRGYGAVKGLQEVGHMLLLHLCICHRGLVPTLHICLGHTSLTSSGPPPCAPHPLVFPVEASLTTNQIMKERLYKCNQDFNRPGENLSRGDKFVLNIVERARLWKLLTRALWVLQLIKYMYLYLLKAYLPVFKRIPCLLLINLPSRFCSWGNIKN